MLETDFISHTKDKEEHKNHKFIENHPTKSHQIASLLQRHNWHRTDVFLNSDLQVLSVDGDQLIKIEVEKPVKEHTAKKVK